ncbi:MAG: tetrahydrofolate synthase, partial [Treponema sp.]|nr:tetrahydrofolate synthase [Treponema sp.]
YAGAGEELRGIYRRFKDSPGGLGEPTFFELMTLYFFLCARRERWDVMVVETGLGGRLDATNIVDPLVSLISLIELEHTEYLGATIEEVAAEKAGIITEGRPVIIAAQEPAVLAVLRKRAGEKAAPLYYLPEEVEILNTKVDRGGTSFLLREPGEAPGSPGKRRENQGKFLPPPAENPDGGLPCRVPMPGAVQGRNAALAAAAARLAFPETDGDAIRRGLERTALPARFERLRCPVPFIVDGAHTPASVSLCVESFRALYGGGGILLFGCAAGKDEAAMSELLVPHFKVILITGTGSFRASSPERAYGAFLKAAGSSGGPSIKLIRETGPAIARALELAAAKQLPVLGTGSFYLAAEIRDRLGSAPPPAIP